MKRAIGMFGLLAVLFATLSLATIADSKTMTWTGWISDDHWNAVPVPSRWLRFTPGRRVWMTNPRQPEWVLPTRSRDT